MAWAQERYYKPDQRENDTVFLRMVEKSVSDVHSVLDAGAGAGDAFPYSFRGKVKEMVGIDLDPRVVDNPRLDRGVEGDLNSMPFPDACFDVVFSRYVLEHVAEPEKFANEIARVLKPGGLFFFLTPSKWHYVAVLARLTPDWFHDWYNEKLRGRSSEDTFPTCYKLNAAGDLNRELGQAGLVARELIFREVSPNYFLWSFPLFYLGMFYERVVNHFGFLSPFRVNILGCYEKKV